MATDRQAVVVVASQQTKSVKKQRLQQCLHEIRRFISEQEPTDIKIGTVEALRKTLQLLKTIKSNVGSAHCQSSSTDPVDHSDNWSESPPMIFGDEIWSFSDRLVATVKVSLPDGLLVDVRRVVGDGGDFEHLRIGRCFFDVLTDGGGQLLMASADGKSTNQKRKLFARIRCGPEHRLACELLCEFHADPNKHLSGYHSAKIYILQLNSAYSTESSDEFHPATFTTRHGPTSALVHLDASAVPFLGHLPNDLLGASLLAIIHADDVHIFKTAHLQLIAHKGRLVRTGLYRLVAHNGAIVGIESEWSGYLNPWTRQLDMILGRHRIIDRVIKGAENVFAEPPNSLPIFDKKAIKIVEMEIGQHLARPIAHTKNRHGEVADTKSVHLENQGDLTAFDKRTDFVSRLDHIVETLVVGGNHDSSRKYLLCSDQSHNGSPERHGSGGEMSRSPPDSSGSGPSYNQINCFENVHRLLQSQPKTDRSNDSDKARIESNDNLIHSRSHSAYELGPAMPLTRELLQQHTRQWEREYKDHWKRRNSTEIFELKRPSLDTLDPPVPSKVLKEAAHQQHRPASIPMLPKGADYYRSLGPNPPPPPGRNFQITSAPLPSPDRKSAFAPVLQQQPINLSLSDNKQNQHSQSVIQQLPQNCEPFIHLHNALLNSNEHSHGNWHAVRLMGLAQNALNRANNNRNLECPVNVNSCPLKEATDALMMLQETS